MASSSDAKPIAFARFIAVDGGTGAHALAALAGMRADVRQVHSPRHANLLLIFGPLAATMREPLAETAQAMPRPSAAILVERDGAKVDGNGVLDVGAQLRPLQRLPTGSVMRIAQACADLEQDGFEMVASSAWKPDTIDVSPAAAEMETELVVVSLGPVQPFTAGPLRILLTCDGEQIVRADVAAGYAFRGIAESMTAATWRDAAEFAAALDPLAPIAGRLAYVGAVEALQRRRLAAETAEAREGFLALERARNHLWWFVRFAGLIGAPRLAERARDIAMRVERFYQELSVGSRESDHDNDDAHDQPAALASIARAVEALRGAVVRDRLLAMRCKGIGMLAEAAVLRYGVSGPTLAASRAGRGDASGRMIARLEAANRDLRSAADKNLDPDALAPLDWRVPRGSVDVAVDGPRGSIGLTLQSDGGDGPARAGWRRPSAAMLELLPELLRQQIVADAEIIIASLDIAMAEADG
jgi:NADH-quinone oxidoreductase subunit D